MRPEYHKAIELEDTKVNQCFYVSCLNLFPNAYTYETKIYYYDHKVSENYANQSTHVV